MRYLLGIVFTIFFAVQSYGQNKIPVEIMSERDMYENGDSVFLNGVYSTKEYKKTVKKIKNYPGYFVFIRYIARESVSDRALAQICVKNKKERDKYQSAYLVVYNYKTKQIISITKKLPKFNNQRAGRQGVIE